MANSYFQFKHFVIQQDRCAMKVTTDGCLFGAWVAQRMQGNRLIVDSVLDIGAGTGLLSLMVAQQSSAKIDAIEIDNDAFEQAKENIANSPWQSRINLIHGDARDLPESQQYDVIISNPPFYQNELKSENDKKNRAHHDEGLLLDDLLTIVQANLKPGGEFYLLLPYKRNEELEKAFVKKRLVISDATMVRQSTQHNFFRILLTGKHSENNKETFITSEIAIKNEKQEYTPAFIKLLKDYYLYL